MAGIGGLPEEAKERLVEEGGLDPSDGAGLVLLPKIHAAESRGLDVAAKLCCGLGLSVGALTEPESSLDAGADGVGVAVVDTAGHEAADTVLGVGVQLQTSSEGGSNGTVTNLSGYTELRYEVTVRINGTPQAGTEGKVTVTAEQTLCGSYTANGSQTSRRQCVLHALVRVGLWNLEKAGQKAGRGLRAWHGRY